MADLEFDVFQASTKEEYEAFHQFLIDSREIAPPKIDQLVTPVQKVRESRIGEDWKQFAACIGVDTELFYDQGQKVELEKERVRQQMCGSCAVRTTCIAYAIERKDQYGVWGGFNFLHTSDRKAAREFISLSKSVRKPQKSA